MKDANEQYYIEVSRDVEVLSKHALDKITTSIGRSSDNAIVLSESCVSGHQARIDRTDRGLFITDLGSTNGTFVNNKKLEAGKPYQLNTGDNITIKPFSFKLYCGNIPTDEALLGGASVSIGRSSDGNDIKLYHPTVSRKHARIIQHGVPGNYIIEDLGSTNGTFVNGERLIQPRVLHTGDIVNIGPYKFIYSPERPERLEQLGEASGYLRIEAQCLRKTVERGKNLLQDISLSIEPGQFVAIVGPSGAGKSTLLHALNGFDPATSGKVLINGDDLYKKYDTYRNQFGYVPQQNIVHMGLTVYEVLDYSARLRLPADTTKQERDKRIEEVLSILKIQDCVTIEQSKNKKRLVGKLSGGEQRRVALGVELIVKPGVFFLDEATTGLDPYVEGQIMRLLHGLTKQGHTILLVTHATDNITECDKVVCLAKGGRLEYYGTPADALQHFGVKHERYNEIYEKLQGKDTSPADLVEKYLDGEKRNKKERQKYTAQSNSAGRKPRNVRLDVKYGAKQRRISSIRQLVTLSLRNMDILRRDKFSLILMLAIAPVIGFLDFLFWQHGLFATQGGNATRAVINLYMAAIVCFLVGSLASIREIVKETDIYRRERMVCLKILPYALSKLWMAVLISLYSAIIFTLFIWLAGRWPPVEQLPGVFLTLTLATLAGMTTGLLISSLSTKENRAPLILLVFLVPQVLFGGVIPEKYFVGSTGRLISQLTPTRWAFESLVTISDVGSCVADDQCRQENCVGPKIFTDCSFPGISDYYDQGDEAMSTLKAEEAIASVDERYGNAFKVNLAYHWIIIVVFIAVFFGLTLASLRLQDNNSKYKYYWRYLKSIIYKGKGT